MSNSLSPSSIFCSSSAIAFWFVLASLRSFRATSLNRLRGVGDGAGSAFAGSSAAPFGLASRGPVAFPPWPARLRAFCRFPADPALGGRAGSLDGSCGAFLGVDPPWPSDLEASCAGLSRPAERSGRAGFAGVPGVLRLRRLRLVEVLRGMGQALSRRGRGGCRGSGRRRPASPPSASAASGLGILKFLQVVEEAADLLVEPVGPAVDPAADLALDHLGVLQARRPPGRSSASVFSRLRRASSTGTDAPASASPGSGRSPRGSRGAGRRAGGRSPRRRRSGAGARGSCPGWGPSGRRSRGRRRGR